MSNQKQAHCIIGLGVVKESCKLDIKFAAGWQTFVDLSDFLASLIPLCPLLEPVLFKQAVIGEWGFEVTWDGGNDLSIAATTLRRLAEEQSGEPARRFNACMKNKGLSNQHPPHYSASS